MRSDSQFVPFLSPILPDESPHTIGTPGLSSNPFSRVFPQARFWIKRSAGRDDLRLLQALSRHEYRLVARAAAVRLAQFGDDGMAMLQSAVSGAIEQQVAENFGAAVRDAETERFGLIELW